jgi:16S rRNA (cytosine1402-N4)-methyltransferase
LIFNNSDKPAHEPVMLKECLEALNVHEGGRYLDATMGYGGHSGAILSAAPGVTLTAIDRDADAVAHGEKNLKGPGRSIDIRRGNYAELEKFFGPPAPLFDGILADLGVSSAQLDVPERGFSFMRDGPLDMRMDQGGGETAGEYLRRATADGFEKYLRAAGEERFGARIARQIIESAESFRTTADLADFVKRRLPRRGHGHPATRVFMALRMAVNQELESLEKFLNEAPKYLKDGGRLAMITFHSTEDRLVKHFFKNQGADGPVRAVTKKPLEPTREEESRNPRSRSAKLRVYEKRGSI